MKVSKGFSLIEMLVVVAILGAALAIAIPSLITYRQSANLREAARDLASDIALYRQRAVAENRHYRISFNQGANNYTIQQENPANSGAYNAIAIKSLGDISNAVIISDDPAPSFTGGVPTITFQPRGTMGAGSLKLRHTVSLSEKTITTNLMGRVKVGD